MAAVATLVTAVLFVAVIATFDAIAVHRQVAQVDLRLHDRLVDALHTPGSVPGVLEPDAGLPAPGRGDNDVDAAPVFVWRVDARGKVVAGENAAPTLEPGSWSASGAPTTAVLGGSEFRLTAERYQGGFLVAGISLAEVRHLQSLLLAGAVIAGPVVLLTMFLGSLLIGVKASAPLEQARRRQLEFTADASHELRTPLSVIEAEVGLALRAERPAPVYRQALQRVGDESARLRRIVDDLLWLARFDSAPPPPAGEPIDLSTIAEQCVERFTPVASSRSMTLSAERRGDAAAWVDAPPEWMDRLAAVLVDNACRYTPVGGSARVAVETRPGRVGLVVEDSGPGIPAAERARLFDRFHRLSDEPGGTGLGLAIADSIVRTTGGRWHVGDSELGGARLEVTWHRPNGGERGASERTGGLETPERAAISRAGGESR